MFIVRCLENNRMNTVEQKENRFLNFNSKQNTRNKFKLCYIGNKKSKEVRNTRKTQKEGSS